MLGAAAGLAAISAAPVVVGRLDLDSERRMSPELARAASVCVTEPSCVEWRVVARCEYAAMMGHVYSRPRAIRLYARSSVEAEWMISHFERGCVVERVDLAA